MSCAAAPRSLEVGVSYQVTCAATNGTAPYTWSVSAGALPAGTTTVVSGAGNATYTISGTLTTAGPLFYTAQASDSATNSSLVAAPQTGSATQSGTVLATPAINCTITTGPTQVNSPYTDSCTVSGGTLPFTWQIAAGGALPAGVTLTSNGTAALVSGTPTTAGAYSFTIQVTDGASTPQSASTGAFVGAIATAPTTISVAPSSGAPTYGNSVTITATVTAGSSTVTTGTITITDTTTSTALGTALALSSIGQASVTLSTLSAINHTIQATYNPDAGHGSSSNTTAVNVGKAALTVTATSAGKSYGATLTPTVFSTNGLVNGDTVTGVTLSSAGSVATATVSGSPYSIVPSATTGTGLGNYTVAYVAASLTVSPATLTITATGAAKTYGVSSAPSAFTTSGLVNSDTVTGVTLTSTGSATSASVAGSPYLIIPSGTVGTGLANYLISYVNGALTVSPAALTVTASGATKTYGAVLTPTAFSTAGLVNGDTVSSVTLTSSGSAATAVVSGAPYTIVPSAATGSGLANYTISYTNGTLAVNPAALTVTAANSSKTAGQTVVFAGTEFAASGLVNGDTVTRVTLTSAGSGAGAAAGTYPIVASAAIGTGLVNYATGYVNGSLVVNAVVPQPQNISQLSVTASATTVTQGQSVVLTLAVTGSLGFLPPATGSVNCTVDNTNPQTAAVASGSGTLTLSGLSTGTHAVACSFGGDGSYPPASGIPLTLIVQPGLPAIKPGGVVSAAGFSAAASPGGLLSIFGTNISAGNTATATSLPLPVILGNTEVLVAGTPCPLLFVSPDQINCVVSYGTPTGQPVQVVVVAGGSVSLPVMVTFAPYAPSVFTYQRTPTATDPVIVHAADNTLVTPTKPAQAGEFLVIYATGVGKLNNSPADGAGAPSFPPATTAINPTVTVGGKASTVLFSGLTPTLVGLLQINVQLPPALQAATSGTLPFVVTYSQTSSPAVNLWVAATTQ